MLPFSFAHSLVPVLWERITRAPAWTSSCYLWCPILLFFTNEISLIFNLSCMRDHPASRHLFIYSSVRTFISMSSEMSWLKQQTTQCEDVPLRAIMASGIVPVCLSIPYLGHSFSYHSPLNTICYGGNHCVLGAGIYIYTHTHTGIGMCRTAT